MEYTNKSLFYMESAGGIEPPTYWLRISLLLLSK